MLYAKLCLAAVRRCPGGWPVVLAVVCMLAAATPATGATQPARAQPVDMSVEWLRHPRPAVTDLKAPAARERRTLAGPVQRWALRLSDRTLSSTLQRWAQAAGWQLLWEAERDFPIEAEVEIQADFAGALDQVMRSLARTDYPLQVSMNPETRILRLRRQFETQP